MWHKPFWNDLQKQYCTARQLPKYHFTIFLHFSIEIKNKKQKYNFSESLKSRMLRFSEPQFGHPCNVIFGQSLPANILYYLQANYDFSQTPIMKCIDEFTSSAK